MHVVSTVADLRQRLKKQKNVAFVPTMGNLHAGHIHLVELARQHGQCVVVSIFVNPLQFGANEDLASYPRTLDADLAKLKLAGADIVFTPNEHEIYPVPQTLTVQPPAIANELCGASRPDHFQGVATVVLKLFNMVQPQVAVFGKKDYQQLFIIRELVRQLNLLIEIIPGETVREPDGLAMSSRNGYLTPLQRKEAPLLHHALKQIAAAINKGGKEFSVLESDSRDALLAHGWKVDYVSVRSAETLFPASPGDQKLVILGAAFQGNTRLIDNLECCSAT